MSRETQRYSLDTALAFNGEQLQTVVDGRSRDSWHNEVTTCFTVTSSLHIVTFPHAPLPANQVVWSCRYSEALASTTNSAHSCTYSAPKHVGHLQATVQKKTVWHTGPTRIHYVKLLHKAVRPIFYGSLQNPRARSFKGPLAESLNCSFHKHFSWPQR